MNLSTTNAYPTKDEQIRQLVQRLTETEAELNALTEGHMDAFMDPASGLPILSRQAQAEMRRAPLSLEQEVRQQAIDLTRASQVLQTLVGVMPVGAVITDGAGKILITNEAGRAILGSPVSGSLESPERSYTPLYPDGSPLPAEDMPLMHALREGRVIRDFEILIRRAGGEERTILASAAPIKDDTGKIVSAIAVFQDVTELVRVLAELEVERSRLKAVIENAPEGIVLADRASRLILANPAAEALYRRPVPIDQDVESHAGLALCYPDGTPYPPRDLPLARSALDGEARQGLEMAIIWPDGQRRSLLVNTAPIRDQSSQIVGAVGIFQDISDLKETQRLLERYVARLNALHETDQAILAAKSVQEIVTAALRNAPQLLDCVRTSIMLFDRKARKLTVLAAQANGQSEVNAGWHGPWVDDAMMDALGQGKSYVVEEIESRTSSPLLAKLWAEGIRAYVNVPIFVENELEGSLNLGLDRPGPLTPEQMEIAQELANEVALAIQQTRLREELRRHAGQLEQKVAQRTAALQASEARFRTIFEDSILGIALLDETGRILASNPALHTILGYGEDQLQGTSLNDYSHPDDANTHQDLFRSLAAAKLAYYQVQKRYVRKDGAVRWIELTLSGVKRIIKSDPIVAIVMLEDVTEKRTSQQVLMSAERQAIAGRLGPSLAHEINNPLQAVIGCLGLVDEMLEDGAEARSYLQIAMEELERAAGIVTQLRDLGRRPESSKKELADLNVILEKVLTLTRKRCQNQGVEVAWRPAAGLPALPVFPDRVQQVFLNLVLNAVEAMPTGGRLQISTESTDRPAGIRIRFADTGVGIEPANLPQLFEPFQSSRPEGLGLGLYISRTIIEEHGGRIEVDSRVGEGTIFSLWLPK